MFLADSSKEDFLYLDNAAAFVPEKEVLEYYFQLLGNIVPNQEAAHQAAFSLRENITKAASNVAAIVVGEKQAANYQVIFGNSATELFNLFFKYPEFAKLNIAATKLLHLAAFNTLKDNCPKVEFLPVDRKGTLNLACLENGNFEGIKWTNKYYQIQFKNHDLSFVTVHVNTKDRKTCNSSFGV